MLDKPKVFSLWKNKPFASRFGSIDAMAETDIFVQCIAFDVILPVIPKQEHLLNIFEETVLKLTNLSVVSSERISGLICFDKDLVRFIQDKLSRCGYIEKDYSISPLGKTYLNDVHQRKAKIKNTQGKIFVDRASGKLLPYIHIGNLEYEDVSECDGRGITINIGSAGRSRKISGSMIVYPKETTKWHSSAQRDVRKNIVSYNRLCRNQTDAKSINIDPTYMIDISSSGEVVYVHNKLVIQRGNIDSIIASDGFSVNNESAASYISKNYSSIVDTVKRFAANNSVQAETGKSFTSKKYYEVERLLIYAEGDGLTIDERRWIKRDNEEKVAGYYSAIEWSFNYYLKQNPVGKAVLDLYRSQSVQENIEKSLIFAKAIGVYQAEKYDFLFGIASGNIHRFEQGGPPEMQTVLSLSIINAKYNPNSVVHSVIKDFNDFLKFIAELKALRDSQSHGSSKDKRIITENDVKYCFDKTLQLVKCILPDFEKQDALLRKMDDISQKIINADVALTKELGTEFYNQVDIDTKSLLRDISPDKNKSELPQPFEYVRTLYIILEHYLYGTIGDLLQISNGHHVSQNDVVNKIANIAVKCPISLSSVRSGKFEAALKGKSATLGGYTLALFALSDSELNGGNGKTVINTIDEVLRLRQHGNNVGLTVSSETLNALRQKVFETIKIIGGII